jgi:hypothetical protein
MHGLILASPVEFLHATGGSDPFAELFSRVDSDDAFAEATIGVLFAPSNQLNINMTLSLVRFLDGAKLIAVFNCLADYLAGNEEIAKIIAATELTAAVVRKLAALQAPSALSESALRLLALLAHVLIDRKELGEIMTIATKLHSFLALPVIKLLISIMNKDQRIPCRFFTMKEHTGLSFPPARAESIAAFTLVGDFFFISDAGVLFEAKDNQKVVFKVSYSEELLFVGTGAAQQHFPVHFPTRRWHRIVLRLANGILSLFTITQSEQMQASPPDLRGSVTISLFRYLLASFGAYAFSLEPLSDRLVGHLLEAPSSPNMFSPTTQMPLSFEPPPPGFAAFAEKQVFAINAANNQAQCATIIPGYVLNLKLVTFHRDPLFPQYLFASLGGLSFILALFMKLDESEEADSRVLPILLDLLTAASSRPTPPAATTSSRSSTPSSTSPSSSRRSRARSGRTRSSSR